MSKAPRSTLGPTHLLTQWVPGALSQGVKGPGREADLLPPSGAEVNYAYSYTSSGFGGLVVSMLASGTQDRGFDPG